MHEYRAIDRAAAELSRLLRREAPLESVLTVIGELAVAAISSCQEAGVSLEKGGKVLSRTTTGEASRTVDDHQYEIDEGPCIEASRTQTTVLIEDMATDQRWPRFATFAKSQGVVSSYSIPMIEGSEVIGVLNLYSTEDAFGLEDELVGSLFASEAAAAIQHAATAVKTRELIANLNQALESRSVIGTAVGIVMHRDRINMAEAFETLVAISSQENLKLRDVAERITAQYDSVIGRLAIPRND